MAGEATPTISEEQTAFFRHNVGWLRRAAFARCRDPGITEDLVQEVFVKLFRAWSERTATRAYASTVLTNCYRDELRRRKARVREVADEDLAELAELRALLDKGPEELSSEVDVDVRGAIRSLPPQLREVVYRVYYEGLSLAEAATAMGLGPRTIHNYHHLAKKKVEAGLSHLGRYAREQRDER